MICLLSSVNTCARQEIDPRGRLPNEKDLGARRTFYGLKLIG